MLINCLDNFQKYNNCNFRKNFCIFLTYLGGLLIRMLNVHVEESCREMLRDTTSCCGWRRIRREITIWSWFENGLEMEFLLTGSKFPYLLKLLKLTGLNGQWDSSDSAPEVYQLILQKAHRANVHEQLHTSPAGGHFGVNKKGPRTRIHVEMARYMSGTPFEQVAVDILGPLHLIKSWSKYLVVEMYFFPSD